MATSSQSGAQDSFKKALKSMKTVKEVLDAFKAMETFFSPSQLGYHCFVVAQKLFKLEAFHQVLEYGTRALTAFTQNHDNTCHSCLRIVDVLRLLGITCYNLNTYDASLDYFNRANTNLRELLTSDEDNRTVLESLADIQEGLFTVKDAMGNRDEAVVHATNVWEIRVKTLEEGSFLLGDVNMGVSDAYLRAFDHESALPFCLKALEIYQKHLSEKSLEIAQVKRSLAVMYHGLGEYYRSLELNQAAVSVLKDRTPDSQETMIAEVEGASTMIELGQCTDVLEAMKSVVERGDLKGWLRVKSLLTMARALCYLRKFDDAKRYMSVPRAMLEGKEIDDPVLVPVGLSDLSFLYAMMNDLETAVAMLKTGLACSQIPQKLLVQLCEALMSRIYESNAKKSDFQYMVREVKSLKETFGLEHCVVGFGYSRLGVAYLESGQQKKGAKSLVNAKTILDVTLGQNHLISLKTSHTLSVAYDALGRHMEAIKIEEEVVEGLQGMGPSGQMLLNKAVEHLSNMKERCTYIISCKGINFSVHR